MKRLTLLVMCFCGILLFGCTRESNEQRMEFLRTVEVTDWLPEETFVTFEEAKKIDGLDIGRVIVKRTKDGGLFSVLVIPMKEIQVHSQVKVSRVGYWHNEKTQVNLWVVR